ncbi:MAG: phosphoglucosamine mutase [Flavobacteriales bacterium]|nr:phosphoglucosamine mutase [Flavobacteriales bacterium]|tara:strand:- start:2387 stop:3793 length:1407 start_codon:yes stop_codon:yes gene_type:complete
MTLITSISGIRGTIGGIVGDSLSPVDIVRFTTAYANFIKSKQNNIVSTNNENKNTIVIGRDARISGLMVRNIVSGVLMSCGLNVKDLGLSTTPTVEMAVILEKAAGGIIITASHNPKQWNALKLLNNKGEFLSNEDGNKILGFAKQENYLYNKVDFLGNYIKIDNYNDIHINKILNLPLVDVDLIKSVKFKVVLDAVNSTGGIIIPQLLNKLGVQCIKLYCEPNGKFPHNPEPLPENLVDISNLVVKKRADLGIVVDPDVDRLAFICEDGSMFGEEYTLVAVTDYILQNTPGNTVSNLSSTQALKDITEKYDCEYNTSAVGEVNVVQKMKETNAVIGGEGNGGVIYPSIHYGRDALVGVALFLTFLAKKKIKSSELRKSYPNYFISKNKIKLDKSVDLDAVFRSVTKKYKKYEINTIDGVKIILDKEWIHLRKSNTEPIIRIYAESTSEKKSQKLAEEIINFIELTTS